MKIREKISWVAVVLVALFAVVLIAGETKYNVGTTLADVVFGPARGKTTVKSVYATTDLQGGAVRFYARGGGGKFSIDAATTNGATNLVVDNADSGLAASDLLVYSHASGLCETVQVDNASASNVTLYSGITEAGTTSDYIYEMSLQGRMEFGLYGTGAGTNDVLNVSGDSVFVSPGDSPIWVTVDGTATSIVQVTVEN